ncbi:MAG: hypothetical protein MUD01_06750 [Chloroflexaceae bacterium]|jgi:hypothetical protein|nr:hypothetical protein [Chloroflexaceae bacterium]
MPKFIPRPLFQSLLFVLLPGAVLLAIYWWRTDQGLYRWFVTTLSGSPAPQLLGVLLTLLANLSIVLLIAMVLRPFALMPSLRSQRDPAFHTPPSLALLRFQAKGIGIAMITLGLVFGAMGLASLADTSGTFYRWQVVAILSGVVLIPWGIVKLMFGKKP